MARVEEGVAPEGYATVLMTLNVAFTYFIYTF